MKRVLIIDDDPDICLLLTRFLTRHGFTTKSVSRGNDGLTLLKQEKFNLVLCDFRLPDIDGLDMLSRAKIINPEVAFIIITGYSDIKTAVKAIKSGAVDYVTKPIPQEEILNTIQKIFGEKLLEEGSVHFKQDLPVDSTAFIHGTSKKDKEVYQHIQLVAPTDMSVIIYGETGTGKEYVARMIHSLSKRASKPFIAIDCGALPKDLAGSEFFGHEKGAFTGAIAAKVGNFELANGGTLFLDEIGNLSYDIQVKLLRVLQEKMFRRVGGVKDIITDVRILVASNEDLKDAFESGKFREDLYHRLNEFNIEVSPLRERKEDIIKFALHFLNIANSELGKDVQKIAPEAERAILQYPWYGNLRELKNAIKRAVLICQGNALAIECLPRVISDYHDTPEMALHEMDGGTGLRSAAMIAERDAIVNALDKSNHNKTKAARLLNIDRKTLYNKLKSYNIQQD